MLKKKKKEKRFQRVSTWCLDAIKSTVKTIIQKLNTPISEISSIKIVRSDEFEKIEGEKLPVTLLTTRTRIVLNG